MKKRFFAVMAAIVVICSVFSSASAQCFYRYDYGYGGGGLFGDGANFYAGFGAGAALVNDMASPTYSVRLGVEAGLFVAELEGSYLSINSVYDDGFEPETNTLSTMTVGVNVGLNILASSVGRLSLMLHTGYALQEEWYHGGYYDYYGHAYYGRYYIGAGLNGSVNLTNRFALFAEARYQSIPIDGCGKTKWGGILSGGLRIYF